MLTFFYVTQFLCKEQQRICCRLLFQSILNQLICRKKKRQKIKKKRVVVFKNSVKQLALRKMNFLYFFFNICHLKIYFFVLKSFFGFENVENNENKHVNRSKKCRKKKSRFFICSLDKGENNLD